MTNPEMSKEESGDLAVWAERLTNEEFVELVRGDLGLWVECGSLPEQMPTWHPWAMRQLLNYIDELKGQA